jgi:hypothetical protein
MAVAQGYVDKRSTERIDPEVHGRKRRAKLAAKPKRKYVRKGARLSSCRTKLGALRGPGLTGNSKWAIGVLLRSAEQRAGVRVPCSIRKANSC